MRDFTELMKNQVFNEDANGFEKRKGPRHRRTIRTFTGREVFFTTHMSP